MNIGNLMLATDADETTSRIVLVTHVGETISRVLLVSNETDLASDFDVIVRDVVSWPIVIMPELFGTVFNSQLLEVLGTVNANTLQGLRDSLATDADSVAHLETGVPLGAPDCPRRAFKERELDELLQIIAPSRQAIADSW